MDDSATEPDHKGHRLGDHRVVSRWWIGGGLVALGVIYVIATFVQVWWSSGHFELPETGSAGSIVVLGAAQWDGDPSPVLQGRLDRGFELWEQGVAPVLITTGSNQPGDRFTEGFAGFEYLRNRGVPEEDLRVVVDGTDTWEQLTATTAVLVEDSLGGDVVLVSDPYHNHRLLLMAEELGLNAQVAPTSLDSSLRELVRETAATSVGRLISWRRLSNLR